MTRKTPPGAFVIKNDEKDKGFEVKKGLILGLRTVNPQKAKKTKVWYEGDLVTFGNGMEADIVTLSKITHTLVDLYNSMQNGEDPSMVVQSISYRDNATRLMDTDAMLYRYGILYDAETERLWMSGLFESKAYTRLVLQEVFLILYECFGEQEIREGLEAEGLNYDDVIRLIEGKRKDVPTTHNERLSFTLDCLQTKAYGIVADSLEDLTTCGEKLGLSTKDITSADLLRYRCFYKDKARLVGSKVLNWDRLINARTVTTLVDAACHEWSPGFASCETR